jgi:hypothetical protein
MVVLQAMRVIINDKRYGALKTLGERKQAFNEASSFLSEEHLVECLCLVEGTVVVGSDGR